MGAWPGDAALTWEQRFWRRVEKTDGCWHWLGGRAGGNANRWGVYMMPGQRRRSAHAIAYELLVGPIPEGLVLDHLCNKPPCVNPEHLEPVTPEENRRRQAERQTHCRRAGHPLSGSNLYVHNGKRSCRRCRAAAARAAYRKRRAA